MFLHDDINWLFVAAERAAVERIAVSRRGRFRAALTARGHHADHQHGVRLKLNHHNCLRCEFAWSQCQVFTQLFVCDHQP